MNLPRRTIEEVRTRLKLEPSIKEIYVEGFFDRDLYRWGLRKLKAENVIVYPISTVEVPKETIDKYGLTSGERQRLLVFAREIESKGDFQRSVLCIIDADFDYILDCVNLCNVLCTTSGTSAELLFLDVSSLLQFYETVLSLTPGEDKINQTLRSLIPALRGIFLIRAAVHALALNWSVIDIEDELQKDRSFDFDEYLGKVINKNKGQGSKVEVLKKIEELRTRSAHLPDSKCVHGHDFVAGIRKSLINAGVKRKMLADSNEVGRILLGMLDWDVVKDDQVFQAMAAFGG
jgi:hypothetical protein